jgi:hypothetical protein
MTFARILDPEHRKSRHSALVLGMAAGFLFAGCGGRQAEAEKPVAPATIASPPEYEMSKMPEARSAAPRASDAGATPAPPPPPAKKPKGMQPLFTSDKGVSTIVGTQGAVFRVAGATLRIPENALRDGKDIRFAPSRTPSAKGEPARLGAAFDIGPALPSVGPPFELVFPLPADASDIVLVTVLRSKTKDGKAKTEVSTHAPKSVDPSQHEVLFELAQLPEGDVYIAKKPLPTSSPEPSATSSAAPPAVSASAPPRH